MFAPQYFYYELLRPKGEQTPGPGRVEGGGDTQAGDLVRTLRHVHFHALSNDNFFVLWSIIRDNEVGIRAFGETRYAHCEKNYIMFLSRPCP
jgi:hypothetical protein